MPRRRSIQWRASPFWKQTARHGTRRAHPVTAERARRTVSGSVRAGPRRGAEAAAATRRKGRRAMASEARTSAASASASIGASERRGRARRGLERGAAMAAALQDGPRRWQLLLSRDIIAQGPYSIPATAMTRRKGGQG